MSTTIDEKVVEMQFDNKQFERNVQTSMSTIEKLKQSLNFSGASKGLEGISSAAKNVNMAGLGNAVETVRMKFSALEVMGVTALANITNSAINTGKQLVRQLTIDPIKTGFQEYETQINAVQTILANTSSKGTTLDQVNAALDELNKYADQTIYNFTEMTRNIGTFTAAGVDLDKSVTSIKGIANLAAASGSSAVQASTAMYQLSQAIAAGKVQLMDWNSVVNAGMGGELFQNALKRTAEHFGYNVDGMIKKYGSFRESLTKGGWLTTEVLTETLTQLSGAYSEADLIAQGYTEDQAKEIAEMAQTALDAATKVKTFTQLWDTLKESVQSGWTQSWEIIIGDFEEAKSLLTEVSGTLGEFVNASAEARNSMLQTWEDLGGRTALIDSIGNAFYGILDVIKPVKEAFREILPPFTGQQLYNLTAGLEELTKKFKIGETTANNLKRTFKGVFAFFDIGVQGVKALAGGLADLIGYIAPSGNGILSFTANIGDFVVSIDEAVKSSDAFNKAIEKVEGFLKPVADGVSSFAKTVKSAFEEFSNIDTSGLEKFSDKVSARFAPFAKIGKMLKNAFGGIASIVEKTFPVFSRLGSIIAEAFENLGNAISEALENASFDPILDLVNTGLFAAILVGIKKFIKSLSEITENGGGILGSLKDILDGVKGSLEAWQSSLKAGTLLKIAAALAVLTASIVALSLIDSEKLAGALGAMSVLFVELIGSLTIFEKLMSGSGLNGIGKLSAAMIAMSASVLILSAAVKNLADLKWDELARGLTGIVSLSAVLVLSATALSKTSGKLIKGSAGLVIFAAAIRVITGAVTDLSGLDTDELTKGLIGVGVLCAELALFLKAADLDGMGVLKGTGLLLLATSIDVIADAVGKFSGLDTGNLIQGLAAIAAVLTELSLFTKISGSSKGLISTATGMTIMGAAMLIFSEAVGRMGELSWEQINHGLSTMAGSLIIVTAAVNMMPNGMIAKAAGLVILGSSLLIIGQAVQNMGSMSWEEIARGLVTLAGSMTVIAAALNFMTSALPGAAAMLVVSAALAIFVPVLKTLGEMSLAEIGTGLLALAGVFTVLGVAGLVLSPVTPVLLALGAAITLLGVGCAAAGAGILAFSAGLASLAVSGAAGAAALVAVVTSIISLIPMIGEQIASGLLAFAAAITAGAPIIGAAALTIVNVLIQVIAEASTSLSLAVLSLLNTLLLALVSYVPQMTNSGMQILLGFLQGIANNIQAVVEAGIDIAVNFINGISAKIPDVIQAGVDLILSFINGLADAIRDNTDAMVDAMGNLADAMIDGLVKGLFGGLGKIAESAMDLGKEVVSSLKKVLNINSPSKETEKIGEYTAEGYVDGLNSGKDDAIAAAEDLGLSTTGALTKGVNVGLVEFKNHLIDGGNAAEEFWAKFASADDAVQVVNDLDGSMENAADSSEDMRVQTDKTTESVEDLENGMGEASKAIKSNAKETKNATKESEKLFDVMDFGGDVVFDFVNRFGSAFTSLGETAPLEAAYAAVEQLALVTFEASETAAKASEETDEAANNSEKKSESIAKKTVERLNKIKEAFQELRESLSGTIENQMDIFSEFDKKTELSADQLLSNMRSQISGITEWANNLQILAVKGIDQGLLQKLAEIGPKGYEYVSAFVSMTGEQLAEANALYAQSMAIPESASTQIMSSFAYAGLMASQGFANGISTTAGTEQVMAMGTNALNGLQTTLEEHSPSQATYRMGMNLVIGLNNGIEGYSGLALIKVRLLATRILNTFRSELSAGRFSEIGAQICNGLASGISSNSSVVINAAQSVANNAYQAAKDALGIHSPSRKFGEIGKYSMLGFANAISRYTPLAENAAVEAGDQAVFGMHHALSLLSELLSGDIDFDPVIRPVIDMSDVDDKARRIDAMFSRSQAISIGTSMAESGRAIQNGERVAAGESRVQFIQNNYSPKALSRVEIYRQTRNQFSVMKEALS